MMYSHNMKVHQPMLFSATTAALVVLLLHFLIIPNTARGATLYEQTDISTLGETNDSHTGIGNPTQKLGTGLSGTVGSVAYKMNGTNIPTDLADGWGEVQLYACPSDSYTSCVKRADSGYAPTIFSQSGNDAVITVDMTGSSYSFDPGLYYVLHWFTTGDMAVYGSSADTYAGGIGQWLTGIFYDADPNTVDLGFRVCGGTPPNVAAITVDGTALASSYSSIAVTPAATSSTIWSAIITLDKDSVVTPTVKDGTPSFDFTNGTDQTVGDCSDGDAKTFCFTYTPPAGTDTAVYWYFRLAGAQDSSGYAMATTTYQFFVDLSEPVLAFISGPVDGDSVASTSPVTFGFSATDATALTYTCAIDAEALSVCVSPYSISPSPGAHSFAVTATDAVGNATSTTRNFTVLP